MDGSDRRVRTSQGSLIIPPPPTSTPPLPPIDCHSPTADSDSDDAQQFFSPTEAPTIPPFSPLDPLLFSPPATEALPAAAAAVPGSSTISPSSFLSLSLKSEVMPASELRRARRPIEPSLRMTTDADIMERKKWLHRE